VWICPECNQLVPNPVNRKCPNGHGLFDGRIMASTKEQSFMASFFNAIIASVVFVVAASSAGALLAKSNTAWVGFALIGVIAAGITGFIRALKWKRQGGAVLRLVPRAYGMALGCILAGGGLFAIGAAYDLIH